MTVKTNPITQEGLLRWLQTFPAGSVVGKTRHRYHSVLAEYVRHLVPESQTVSVSVGNSEILFPNGETLRMQNDPWIAAFITSINDAHSPSGDHKPVPVEGAISCLAEIHQW